MIIIIAINTIVNLIFLQFCEQNKIILLHTCLTFHNPEDAAAKSHQSCPTLCDPIDGSPPGSPIPGILQARTLEWVTQRIRDIKQL